MCLHCHRHPPVRRGLCNRCYRLPEIRRAYPRTSVTDPDNITPTELPEPTGAMPGTPEKIAVLAERVRLGQHLWHPEDPRLTAPLPPVGVIVDPRIHLTAESLRGILDEETFFA